MKSVLVLAVFALIAVSKADDELKAKLGEITKLCAGKTNFSEENIQKLFAKDYTETENVGCFQKCVFEETGIVSGGAINADKILAVGKNYEKDISKVQANMEKCTPLYKPDSFDCDAAWAIFKCFKQE